MCRMIKDDELKILNYGLKLDLLVLLVGLRRHLQGQHDHTTAPSEKWCFCLSERDRYAGPIPMATGVGVMCSPGKGCIGPGSTTTQYVAYDETTLCAYLYILYISHVWVSSTVLPHLHQKGKYARAGHHPFLQLHRCHCKEKTSTSAIVSCVTTQCSAALQPCLARWTL